MITSRRPTVAASGARDPGPNTPGSTTRRPRDTLAKAAPQLLVLGTVTWNLVSLSALTRAVAYGDDSSIHEQMVRFATLQFRAGHLPLTQWFPYLGLGSPQFLHYQSLPAMLAGAVGVVIGPNAAFRWALYLLLCAWPIVIYWAGRVFGLDRWQSAAAAVMSPLLMSVTGIGYERHAYLWTGYGVWTQLWASMTLPLAWAFSWRAIRHGRSLVPAVVLIALTTALHFETGYLAALPLVLWPVLSGGPMLPRLRRAALVVVGWLLVSAWVIVPLLANRTWAATNEILQGSPLVNGYGAPRLLGWLVSGRLLDAGRIPVITAFAAVGVALICVHWRREDAGRALVIVFAGSLVLAFGRATFGPLVALIPGSADIFFRRFAMGAQLGALWLAGVGVTWCVREVLHMARERAPGAGRPRRLASRGRVVAAAALGAAAVGLIIPAWLQVGDYDRNNAAWVAYQQRAERSQGVQVNRLLAFVKRAGGGRVYAGLPSNWGESFTVGAVPVLKYIEARDVDEVGYTLRTASLMTDPEYYFDERNLSDYSLFGIHYLILPSTRPPPIPARHVTCQGAYCLWSVPTQGYVHVGTVVGTIGADRTNIGVRSIPWLHSTLAQRMEYLNVAFNQRHLTTLSSTGGPARGHAVGEVLSESDDLAGGEVAVTLRMRSAGVAVLSASFDGGWRATLDGPRQGVRMVAPALVATPVPAGTHRIVFRYHGYGGYPWVFLLSALSLAALIAVDWVRRRRRRLAQAPRT